MFWVVGVQVFITTMFESTEFYVAKVIQITFSKK